MRLFMLAQLIPMVTLVAAAADPGPAHPADAGAGDHAAAIQAFVRDAAREFGEPGAKAAAFLVAGMPAADQRALTKEFLLENLRLALRARESFPWAKQVPDELFLDYVLPYAQLDEPRDSWRPKFHAMCGDIVRDCKTATAAVQALNSKLFLQIGVKYDTGRKRPNQSPKESIEQGKASCTGLAIILANACRSVGIPARIAGTALWTNKRGNHTWVEVWDGTWHFTGAAEPTPDGLDRAWFTGDAAKAVATDPTHAIWANTWHPCKEHFPLVWDPSNTSVPAVNVTHHYTGADKNKASDAATKSAVATIHLRVLDEVGNAPSKPTVAIPIPTTALTKAEAATAIDLVWDQWRAQQAPTRVEEMKDQLLTLGDKKMRFLIRTFGTAPADGRSLWISMHGGGGAPAQVNDQQWKNQLRLYAPPEGLYIAPRAPTDNWNLWHEAHIDDLFDRLIENCVLLNNVNPDKVYLMGYSAGGDGVYQLAPRMADRFAAASMMAGHPNDASPLGLYNLPFAIFSGADDAAYNRNQVAAEWGAKLDALAKENPGAYPHRLTIYPGLGHWMKGNDAEAVPWMAKLTRNPWPKQMVWHQAGRLHGRFYWLALPEGIAKPGLTIRGGVANNVITLDAPDVPRLILRLHDRLVDLDQPIKVLLNGKTVFEGKVSRQADAILKSLQQRADPHSAATALLEVSSQ